jgi:hypothetical protein
MEPLEIPPNLQKNFITVCRQLQLDANRVLEQLIARFVSHPPQPSIEEWVETFLGDIKMSDDDEFVGGLTVGDYFALPEQERDKLWEKWEDEANKKLDRLTARMVATDENTLR